MMSNSPDPDKEPAPDQPLQQRVGGQLKHLGLVVPGSCFDPLPEDAFPPK